MSSNRFSRRQVIARVAGGVAASAVSLSTGSAALGRSASTRAQPEGAVLDLSAFGVSPQATPQENLAYFKRAVASTPAGATLRLPRTGPLACAVATAGGWSDAVQIDRPITLQIDGDLRATHSSLRHDPPFILNVTAPGVTLAGIGRIIGDGTIDDRNLGQDETFPGLIRVAADDFTMTGVEIVAPPKVGLMLYQCHRARILGARFCGGPRVYGDTGYFAIRAAGGGDHVFDGNRFYPASDGGMFVQCIMLSGSHGNVFTNNHAMHPYEKLVYGYGDRNVARGNTVIGNPGLIPGTNIQGTITAVFRFHGSYNRVEGNETHGCAGGAQMMDGAGHQVIGNHFLSCGQSAISAYQSDLSHSVFRGNKGTRAMLAGFVGGDGMRLISDATTARNVVIDGNDMTGFSVSDPIAGIAIWQPRTTFGRNSAVKPTVGNGRYYIAQMAGVAGDTEPSWPSTPGATVSDGTITWVAYAYEGGQAEIKLNGSSADQPVVDSAILNNATSGGLLGIVTRFVTHSRIIGNRVQASDWGMVEEAGGYNRWRSNEVRGSADRQVRHLSATSAPLSD